MYEVIKTAQKILLTNQNVHIEHVVKITPRLEMNKLESFLFVWFLYQIIQVNFIGQVIGSSEFYIPLIHGLKLEAKAANTAYFIVFFSRKASLFYFHL